MNKKVKMVLYGQPGTGKSVFACHAPKPFFITTDGNYCWLDEFGAKEEDHIQVNSWSEAKKVFENDFNGYETIVVDLIEDLFKWCEAEFCSKNKITHLGDLGFGKGYDLTRTEFFIEICKLFNKDKNIILLSHGQTVVEKDRRGVEHTKYGPSSKIPDKVWDSIEGRTRYFLRCYLKAEEVMGDGNDVAVIKRRYLSFIPKENEFGVCRGVNESLVPQDLPLDWNAFADLAGLNNVAVSKEEPQKETVTKKIKIEVKPQPKEAEPDPAPKEEAPQPKVETKVVKEEAKPQPAEDKIAAIKAKLASRKMSAPVEQKVEEVKEEIPQPKTEEVKEQVKEEVKEVIKPQLVAMSNNDKIAAIKAKLAAQKAAKEASMNK